jgi:general secretion pathway protein G
MNGLRGKMGETGLTLIELLVVIAIIGILAAGLLPEIFGVINDAKYSRAVQDVNSFFKEATTHRAKTGEFPSNWSDLGYDHPPVDPWGNEYILNNHDDITPGKRRSDGPTIPINDNIDIFSPGPDGEWKKSILATPSKDDVILAEDGGYVGKAGDY